MPKIENQFNVEFNMYDKMYSILSTQMVSVQLPIVKCINFKVDDEQHLLMNIEDDISNLVLQDIDELNEFTMDDLDISNNTITIKRVGPEGITISTWVFYQTALKFIDYGILDYGKSEASTINLGFSYDKYEYSY
jgi:hypothetical protein